MLESGGRLEGELNYYEYGVVSIKLELPFETDWPRLIELSCRWMTTPELEAQAAQMVRRCLETGSTGVDRAARKLAQRRLHHHSFEGVPALTAAELIARARERDRADRSRRAGGAFSGGNRGDSRFQVVLLSGRFAGGGLDGGLYSAIRRRTPLRRFSCWNTPTHSCWSFATTTRC